MRGSVVFGRAGSGIEEVGERGARKRPSGMRLAAVAVIVAAVLATGCTPGSGGSSSTSKDPSAPKLSTPESVSSAASTLADLMDQTRLIGDKDGVTGWEVVGVIDRVESSIASITDDVTAAEKYYSKASAPPESKEALARLTALRQAIVGFIGQLFIMFFAFNRVTQKTDFTQQIGQNIIFDPVSFFFTTVGQPLLLRISRAGDRSLGPVVKIEGRFVFSQDHLGHLPGRQFP